MKAWQTIYDAWEHNTNLPVHCSRNDPCACNWPGSDHSGGTLKGEYGALCCSPCNGGACVTSIAFHNLTKGHTEPVTFPPDFAAFTQLESIHFECCDNNNIGGTIPDSFSTMKHLKTLVLNFMSLEGTVPSWLNGLTNLEVLNLRWNNNIGGTLPVLDKLTSLVEFGVGPWWSDSKFDPAPIPSWLQVAKGLQKLQMPNTSRVGKIPLWLQDRPLSNLELQNNALTGTIPDLDFEKFSTQNLPCNLHGNQGFKCPLPADADSRCGATCTW
jgi:hypothetical protein